MKRESTSTPSKSKRKKVGKKTTRKYSSFIRRLWTDKEDKAILKLTKEYGVKNWTLVAKKLQEEYHIYGRSGKQCRERYSV